MSDRFIVKFAIFSAWGGSVIFLLSLGAIAAGFLATGTVLFLLFFLNIWVATLATLYCLVKVHCIKCQKPFYKFWSPPFLQPRCRNCGTHMNEAIRR